MGLTSEEEILEILKKKKINAPEVLADVLPLTQSLWVLEKVKDNSHINKITAKTISYILRRLGEIPLEETAITRAFARAKDKVKSYKEEGKVYYEIMKKGRIFLEQNMPSSEQGVLFFTGTKAWSDFNKRFPKIIESLKGDLCIVDPFYGEGTFNSLEKFDTKKKIRFLSCTPGTQEQKNPLRFNNNLKQFQSEFKNIVLHKYPNPGELHDRYILADNALVIIGHGLKDLGSKESFVIYIPQEKLGGLLSVLKKSFETKWSQSSRIQPLIISS